MYCGKDGDIFNIMHLICADIAQVSLEQCQLRYGMMNRTSNSRGFTPIYTAEFITADCTKDKYMPIFKNIYRDFTWGILPMESFLNDSVSGAPEEEV